MLMRIVKIARWWESVTLLEIGADQLLFIVYIVILCQQLSILLIHRDKRRMALLFY